MKLILKAFLHRFGDDFRGCGNIKNEQKRGRVALFLIFGGSKRRSHFGAVLGGSGERLEQLFGPFWWISHLFCLSFWGPRFRMFFVTLPGRLPRPKLPFWPFLSLFRFGLKFACQLASFADPHFGCFYLRFLLIFGCFSLRFLPVSHCVWRVSKP